MEVVILGSGTAIPTARRGSASVAVRVGPATTLMLDTGSGATRALIKAGGRLEDVAAIFYSHLHPDHTGGLIPLLFGLKNIGLGDRGLRIIGPTGLKDFLRNLGEAYGEWLKSLPCETEEIMNGEVTADTWRVVVRPVTHGDSSVALRVESPQGTVVYSGDTGYCRSLVELSRGADLLVLECSYPDEHGTEGHLTPSLAGQVSSEAGCSRLVLTHLYPICDEYDILTQCRKVYSGDVIIAEDLMVLSVP